MELDKKRELAFQYVQGSLGPEKKPLVFDLVLRDGTFRRLLKEELELRDEMKKLRLSLDPSVKAGLLAAIKLQAEEERKPQPRTRSKEPEWLRWSECTLGLTLPPIIFPIMKILQRRWIG